MTTDQDGQTVAHSANVLDEGVVLPFHVTNFASDRNGKFAVIDTGSELEVIALPTWQVIRRIDWREGAMPVAIDPGSKKVVAMSKDRFWVWDYGKGTVVSGSSDREQADSMVISPNGRYLWAGDIHGGADLFDLRTMKSVFVGDSREMGSVYFTRGVDISADGTLLVAGFGTGEVKVWRIR